MPAFITWRSVVVQRRSRGCSGRGALGAPPGPKEMGARGLVRSAAVRSVPTWHGFIFVNKSLVAVIAVIVCLVMLQLSRIFRKI